MLNDIDIEPNSYKVYVLDIRPGSKTAIRSINLVGIFEDAGSAINYCDYYLEQKFFYVADPEGNVIYF